MSEEMQLELEHTLKTMRELKEAKAEIERLRAALRVFTCDCTLAERCAVPDNCRNFQARRTLEPPHDRSPPRP